MVKPAFSGIPRGNDKEAISALVKNVETFMGSRGSGLDKAVTLRQLIELNLVVAKYKKGKLVQVENQNDSGIVEPPLKPEGLTATGTWSSIILSWDVNSQASYAYTEIWRSETDNFGDAVKVDQTSGSLHSDGVGTDRAYYYWIRHVNSRGRVSALNATAGTYAETSIDVEKVLEELGEQVNSSHLAQSLRDRIDLIDAPATGLVDQIDSLSVEYSDLSLELTTLASSLLSESGRIDDIISDANTRIANVDQQFSDITIDAQETKDNADKALAVLGSAVDDYVNDGVTIPVFTSHLSEVASQVNYDSDQAALAAIQISLKQDQLSEKLDRYNFDFQTFRDAAFNVDPDNGSIEMVAVDALRTETFSSITTLTQRLDAVDGSISLLGTKAKQDELETQINDVGLSLDTVEAAIELKANQATVNEQASTLSQVSIDLSAAQSAIQLKADLTVTDSLGTALNQLSVDLDAAEAAIQLKADKTVTDGLTTNINSALTRIDAAEAAILTKAESTALNSVDVRVTSAEQNINAMQGEISQKVSTTTFENIIAQPFDSSVQYSKGDQVIYQSQLWECHTDIPAAGNWQSTAYWTNKGLIATRFANAEQRLTATEDGLATLSSNVESLNLDEALTTLAAAEQTLSTYTDEKAAQAEFNQSIQAEFVNSELASIGSHIAQDQQFDRLDKVTYSIAGIEQSQQVLADELQASVEQTELLQAQFNSALASIYNRQAIFVSENEALLKDTKTLTAEVNQSKGLIESIIDLDVSDSAVEGSQLALMYADVGDAKGRISTLETQRVSDEGVNLSRFNELRADIDTEVSTRAADVNRLDEAVATEQATRAASISNLNTKITDETSERESEISRVDESITTEANTRSQAIQGLQSQITDESNTRQAQIDSVQETIADESQARATLATQLNSELAQEAALRQAQIDSAQQTIADESQARAALATQLNSELAQETANREAQIDSVQETIADESQARAALATQLNSELAQETANREAGINNLQTTIATVDQSRVQDYANITASYQSADSALQGQINATNATVTNLTEAITDEETARIHDISNLAATVNSNKSDLDAKYNSIVNLDSNGLGGTVLAQKFETISAQIDALDESTGSDLSHFDQIITDEAQTRASADTSLQSQITDESNTRQAQIGSVQQTIADESQARAALATQLNSELAQETANREAQIDSVQETIADESQARAALATQLNSELAQEAALRQAGISSLQTTIATVDQSRVQDYANITASYQSADSALQGEIDSVKNLSLDANEVLAQTLSSLRGDVDGANGLIEDISNLNIQEDRALAQRFGSISSYLDASALASIQASLALEGEYEKQLVSEASINEAQQTITEINEAQAQKNIEIEAKLSDAETRLQHAFSGVVQAYQAIAREEEARVTENKTLSASLAAAKSDLEGSISALSGVYATPDAVQSIVENNLKSTYNLVNEDGSLAVATSADISSALTGYATENYAESKKQEAISSAASDATSKVNTLTQTLAGDKNTSGSIAKAISQYTANNPEGGSATLEQLFSVAYNKGVAAGNAAESAADTYTAQWGVKTDVNDLQGGVGFYNDGSTTSFLINANLFSFIGPDDTVTPLFTIRQNVEGYEDGVYMRDVYIDDLAVQDVIARTVAADEFKSATSTNVQIVGGSLNINDKFTVDSQGNCEAKAITIRNVSGDVIFSSGAGVPASAVSGLGSLATKSNIDYNTEVNNKPLLGALSQKDSLDYSEVNNTPVLGNLAALDSLSYDAITGTKPSADARTNKIFRQNDDPIGEAKDGDIWYKIATKETRSFNGSSWDLIGNAFSDTSDLVDGAGLGQSATWTSVTGIGKPADNATQNRIFRQANTPTGSNGDLWYNTNTKELKEHNGSSWNKIADETNYTDSRISNNSISQSQIASQVQSIANLTYIKNLLADQVIAARVYAEKIEGDTTTVIPLDISSSTLRDESSFDPYIKFDIEPSATDRVALLPRLKAVSYSSNPMIVTVVVAIYNYISNGADYSQVSPISIIQEDNQPFKLNANGETKDIDVVLGNNNKWHVEVKYYSTRNGASSGNFHIEIQKKNIVVLKNESSWVTNLSIA
ncbi:hypothetical protein [Catenovulum sediminis]|uniref:Fibronectin type-III domain-containing protein n=1 Tax=Catenovulum sediminis TaxID=1740262 RepID=A0ABV1RH97_9ALTE